MFRDSFKDTAGYQFLGNAKSKRYGSSPHRQITNDRALKKILIFHPFRLKNMVVRS